MAVEHGGENLIPVCERSDPIPAQTRSRREQAGHRAEKLVVADREQVLRLRYSTFFSREVRSADDDRFRQVRNRRGCDDSIEPDVGQRLS